MQKSRKEPQTVLPVWIYMLALTKKSQSIRVSLCLLPTGIAIELPDNSVAAFLYARSGLGIKHGICLSNGVGVVDSDYRGEICAGLCNVSDKPYEIEPFERICQMVIAPVVPCDVEEVTELGNTERGEGGFGSTGKK